MCELFFCFYFELKFKEEKENNKEFTKILLTITKVNCDLIQVEQIADVVYRKKKKTISTNRITRQTKRIVIFSFVFNAKQFDPRRQKTT